MKEHAWYALLGKALFACLFFVACTPVQLPQPDPLKGEVVILQKQLLELQKLQLETKNKLDESAITIDQLSLKMKALEDQQSKTAATQIRPKATPHIKRNTSAAKKKPAGTRAGKKKKKIRRQE